MKGNYREAVELINRIRNRAGLGYFNDIDTSLNEQKGMDEELKTWFKEQVGK